ncbi:MAG: hypothetical protein ACTSRI_09565 [Promethearchaeota archaeon]
MEENEIIEGLLALNAFTLFFLIATIGAILSTTIPDSYMYINYDPPEDLLILVSLLLIDCIFIFYFLNQSTKFRKSHNLNYRKGELLFISDKMKYMTYFYMPLKIFIVFFFIKYIETEISIFLLPTLLFELGLIILIFYNSFLINRDIDD